MRVIIAGSRFISDIANLQLVRDAIQASGFDVTEVVSGCALGIDRLGEEWARRNSVPIKPFPAEWPKYGRQAGPLRNQQMADYADALIAIRLPTSRGTDDMIWRAALKGLQSYVVTI